MLKIYIMLFQYPSS